MKELQAVYTIPVLTHTLLQHIQKIFKELFICECRDKISQIKPIQKSQILLSLATTSVLVIHVTLTEGFVAEILVIITNKNSEEIKVFSEFNYASSFIFSLLDLDIYYVSITQKPFIIIILA